MIRDTPGLRVEASQLERIIAGLTEGVIVIEPDRRIAWANPAALAMHGVRSLPELGHTADEYCTRFDLRTRNHHLVPPHDTPAQRGLAGEIFADVVVVVAPVGELPRWTHRVRSLVLENARREPDCLVLILNDETERFNAEERFERAFAANPAPALICDLSTLRYVKVNRGFEEMTGFQREEILGRSICEIDALEGAQDRELAIGHLHAGRTIPQMEASLALPDGTRRPVIVAGQPIECGGEACMLFTFMDLDARKKAEDALRQSEERFAKSFRMAPLPMLVSSLDHFRTIDVNDAFTAVTGYEAQEVVGRTPSELPLWEDAGSRRLFEQTVGENGSVRELELALCRKTGERIDCVLSAETVSILDQLCVLIVLQDVTERKRTESELARAIEAVLQDTGWFSRTVIEKLANLRLPHGSGPGTGLDDLTARETEVLGLICRGLTDARIAEMLEVSPNTVRNQVASIYSKIGVNRRSGAIIWARERGFTGDGPAVGARGGGRRKPR